MSRPKLIDGSLYAAAGIDHITGLPVRNNCRLKDALLANLRLLDEQQAVNRYTWYNLPCALSSQELERFLYHKGQLCFFYVEELDEFYFMPYALDGSIDFYKRYNTIHPVPMTSGLEEKNDKFVQAQADYLSTLRLKVIYDVPIMPVDPFKSTVLLHDYTKQLSENIIPRKNLQEGILEIESEMLPYARTALALGTGVKGMRVSTEDEYSNVKAASESINAAALQGQAYIPIIGDIDFQDLQEGAVAKSEEFLMTMQSIDNIRMSFYGLKNGGIFEKKAHMLEDEQAMNVGKVDSILQDGLSIRQRFADIANAVFGTSIYVEISESAIQTNGAMDDTADDQDQSGTMQGEQEEGGGEQ